MSTVVALDIGSSALAGAELRVRNGRASLARAAVEPIPPGLVHDGEVMEPEELSQQIRRFWRSGRFSGRRVRLGVANQRVLVRTMELPLIEEAAERRTAVEFEAAEQIPIPADQAILDFGTIDRFETASGWRERLVVVAAHREMIETMLHAVRRAGLQPVGVDLEAFALLRALLPMPAAIDDTRPDAPAVAVCHVGAELTNVAVAVERRCHFTRLITFGGAQLTQAVAERTKLPLPEAEALKEACGLLGETPDGWDDERVAEVRHALALGARPLVREISRSLDYYHSQPSARPISRIVLSGGSSLASGFDRYLQQALAMRVEIGDPLRHLDASSGVAGSTAARAAVAVGLALDAPELS